jgi:hypothetical protein
VRSPPIYRSNLRIMLHQVAQFCLRHFEATPAF